MRLYGMSQECLGLRNWLKYVEPFKFNIVVNDMADVMQHADTELPRRNDYGVKSSSADWGYNIVIPGTNKRL